MKSYQQILELLKAGFTREEINAMPEEPETQQPDPEPEAQQTPDLTATLQAYLDKIDSRLMDIQAANIYSAQQPPVENHVKTAEEALEELIRPTGRGNKKKEV